MQRGVDQRARALHHHPSKQGAADQRCRSFAAPGLIQVEQRKQQENQGDVERDKHPSCIVQTLTRVGRQEVGDKRAKHDEQEIEQLAGNVEHGTILQNTGRISHSNAPT